MMSANESLKKKNFPSGWKCYKTIGSYVIGAFIEIWSTQEVWRALKKLELLKAMPRATLTHLSCSPNFPRSSYLDERTLTYEPIVKWLWSWILDKYYYTSHRCSYYIYIHSQCGHTWNYKFCQIVFSWSNVGSFFFFTIIFLGN